MKKNKYDWNEQVDLRPKKVQGKTILFYSNLLTLDRKLSCCISSTTLKEQIQDTRNSIRQRQFHLSELNVSCAALKCITRGQGFHKVFATSFVLLKMQFVSLSQETFYFLSMSMVYSQMKM